MAIEPMEWSQARRLAWELGMKASSAVVQLPVADAIGHVLAEPLTALSPLPPFPTVAMDGFAVAGEVAPWTIVGQQLAGQLPCTLMAGQAVEIATGACLPHGATGIVRLEHSTVQGENLDGPAFPDWREKADETAAGELLVEARSEVTPFVAGLAAAVGADVLPVYEQKMASTVVFGDELLTSGLPQEGRIRDSLSPMLPAIIRALGAGHGAATIGPVTDTLEAHVEAIESCRESDIIFTTGGTMRGPVDHLHKALQTVGAQYLINTVAVRPGFPMLIASWEHRFIVGIPGNPQSALITMATLAAPLLAGLHRRPLPELDTITAGVDIPGRGTDTHLALVDAAGVPAQHRGSAMLRGAAESIGFAVIAPGTEAAAGDALPLLPLPGF